VLSLPLWLFFPPCTLAPTQPPSPPAWHCQMQQKNRLSVALFRTNNHAGVVEISLKYKCAQWNSLARQGVGLLWGGSTALKNNPLSQAIEKLSLALRNRKSHCWGRARSPHYVLIRVIYISLKTDQKQDTCHALSHKKQCVCFVGCWSSLSNPYCRSKGHCAWQNFKFMIPWSTGTQEPSTGPMRREALNP